MKLPVVNSPSQVEVVVRPTTHQRERLDAAYGFAKRAYFATACLTYVSHFADREVVAEVDQSAFGQLPEHVVKCATFCATQALGDLHGDVLKVLSNVEDYLYLMFAPGDLKFVRPHVMVLNGIGAIAIDPYEARELLCGHDMVSIHRSDGEYVATFSKAEEREAIARAVFPDYDAMVADLEPEIRTQLGLVPTRYS